MQLDRPRAVASGPDSLPLRAAAQFLNQVPHVRVVACVGLDFEDYEVQFPAFLVNAGMVALSARHAAHLAWPRAAMVASTLIIR